MTILLDDLYEGKIIPNNENFLNNPKYKETVDQYYAMYEHLYSALDKNCKRIFDDLLDIKCKLEDIECLEYFKYGFSLSYSFMLDSLEVIKKQKK